MVMRILLHSPKDTFAAALAAAAVIAIVVNALFLQAGHHPSPMFGKTVAVPLAAPPATAALLSASPLPRPRPSDAAISRAEAAVGDAGPAETKSIDAPHPAKPVAAPRAPAKQATTHPAVAHRDPLGDLITSTRRTANVQRALTKYGYGQLKPTGTVGSDTQAAIQKFERERKLPVTGKVSDRLVRELSAVTGQAID